MLALLARHPPAGASGRGRIYAHTIPVSEKKYKNKMAITYIDISKPKPKAVVRTRSDVAPLDCRIAVPMSQKSSEFRDTTEFRDKPKRGRPSVSGVAMTAAERQRRCRAAKKAS